MRRIDIYKKEDLRLLSRLSNTETIYLKIHLEHFPKTLEAVDMKGFRGKIIISFSESVRVLDTEVITNTSDTKYIFKNMKGTFEMPMFFHWNIKYVKSDKNVGVSSLEKLKQVIKDFNPAENVCVQLTKSF